MEEDVSGGIRKAKKEVKKKRKKKKRSPAAKLPGCCAFTI